MDNASRPRTIDQIFLVLRLIWSPWQLPFVAWRCSLFLSLTAMAISSSLGLVVFTFLPSMGILEPWRDVKTFTFSAIGVTTWFSVLLLSALSLPIIALWLLCHSFLAGRSLARVNVILLGPVSLFTPMLIWALFVVCQVGSGNIILGHPWWFDHPIIVVGAKPEWRLALLLALVLHWILAFRSLARYRTSTIPTCVKCGYLLTGLADPVICPECGTAEHRTVTD